MDGQSEQSARDEIELVDLGCALEQTKQRSPDFSYADSVFGLGSRPG